MTRRNRPEQALQKAVCQYLDVALPPDAIYWHTPNGGGRSKAEAGIFKAMGVKPGIPDLFILRNGLLFGIELKAGRGTVTAAQEAMHEALERQHVPVAVCRSIHDVYAKLDGYIPLRAKVGGPIADSE